MQITSIACVLSYAHCSTHCKSTASNPGSFFHLLLHLLWLPAALCRCPGRRRRGDAPGARAGDGGAMLRIARHWHVGGWSVWEPQRAACWQACVPALGGDRSAILSLPYQSSPLAEALAQDKFQKCHQFAQIVIAAMWSWFLLHSQQFHLLMQIFCPSCVSLQGWICRYVSPRASRAARGRWRRSTRRQPA